MHRAVRMLFGILSLLLFAIPASAQSVCGNAVREAGEQCDDGNTENGDGCSAQCKFEQNQRMNQLKMQFGISSLCTANAFGAAIVGTEARNQAQGGFDGTVQDGSTSIILAMLGLDDLTGTSDTAVEVGVLSGTPAAAPAGTTYNGMNDLDWWYTPFAADIDAQRLPLSRLPGSITSHVLTAGPGAATLMLAIGSPVPMYVSSLRIQATNGLWNTPLTATGDSAPGHLPSENIDPALQSYATSGDTITGTMCGNIRAGSFAAVPLPAYLTGSPCNNFYTLNNTWLDLLVGGCLAFGVIPETVATQPDQVDPAAPVAGGGPPYVFAADASHHVVSCTGNGQPAVLADCLNAAAYSSYFKFSTDRVIEKPPCTPPAVTASNDGPVCEGGTLHLTAAGPAGEYQWTGPNGFKTTLQNPSIAGITKNDAGTYTVTLTVAGCASAPADTTVLVNDVTTPQIAAPASAAAFEPGLIASVTANAGSTYAWTITNATITAGQGSHQITFTAGASGSMDLRVTETAGNGCASQPGTASVPIVFGAPQGVDAMATSATSVTVAWNPVVGAATYEVARQDVGVVGSANSEKYVDTTAEANKAYLYTVRARDASNNPSPFSNPDLATTMIFTDDPLAAGTTAVKMVHVNELRTTVNAVRALTPLGAFSFTDPALTTDTLIQAVHVSELRTALDQARANLGLPALTYTDATLTPGTTLIKTAHLQEIRAGVK